MIIQKAVPKDLQENIKFLLSNSQFPWYFCESTTGLQDKRYASKLHHFVHIFYDSTLLVNSPNYEKILPILYFFLDKTQLRLKNIIRIKANLLTNQPYTEDDLKSCYHRDIPTQVIESKHELEKYKNNISFIYYVDDSDGDTLIFDEDLILVESIPPKKGNIAWFKSSSIHGPTPPKINQTRKIINFIIEVYGEDENRLNDFLESIDAHLKPHKNGSLKDHLIRTYTLLKTLTNNETISLIGGLHSAYGTEFYKQGCLGFDDNLIKNTFGETVDKYVRMFCNVKRDLLENPDNSINEKDLFILRLVECANLYDQDSLQNRPNLVEFYKKVKPCINEELKKYGVF